MEIFAEALQKFMDTVVIPTMCLYGLETEKLLLSIMKELVREDLTVKSKKAIIDGAIEVIEEKIKELDK